MSNTKQPGNITGKISAAPNPLLFGQDSVAISWETNDPSGSEVRVSTAPGDEKLVSKTGKGSGQTEVAWIVGSTTYEFRLYPASQPHTPVASVQVRRSIESALMALRNLSTEVMRGTIDMTELSHFVAAVIPICLNHTKAREVFQDWEQHGFHVTPVHFYQPIPDTQTLHEGLWSRPSGLAGIEMNDAMQLNLLRNHFPKFREEYEQLPTKPTGDRKGFYLDNGLFEGTDALVAYCMVRSFQPRRIIEVGSGFSSLLLGEAATKNTNSILTCIEPYPQEFLRDDFSGLHSLIERQVQEIELEFFSQLQARDILFIDSSHTVKIGGDVNYLFLEVLPRLNPGVIVHVHDIFLPFDYPREWVTGEFRFWNEQYLLQAFLTFNSEFEVLMANNYLAHRYSEDLKAAFPSLEKLSAARTNSAKWGGGSFWMRRRSPASDSDTSL